MHNLYARFVKILEICKKIGKDLVNKDGNIPRRGVIPRFSDLEVLSLSMTSESLGIDSEAYLFSILKNSKEKFPNLIVGAKTGTAEVEGQKPNAMLAGFVSDPEKPLAFLVCVEDAGYGKTVCIPIASKVLETATKALK